MQLRNDSDYILMLEILLTFVLHMQNLLRQMFCSHPVATGDFKNKSIKDKAEVKRPMTHLQ